MPMFLKPALIIDFLNISYLISGYTRKKSSLEKSNLLS